MKVESGFLLETDQCSARDHSKTVVNTTEAELSHSGHISLSFQMQNAPL